jgi:hypothetical protein
MEKKKQSRPTQCDLILKYIRDFGSISTWEAMMDLGVARLASRIFDLKNKGYKFRKQRVYTNNRYDKKIYYDRYFLVEESA